MQMCPPGYHYIAIVIPALGHRDVRYIYTAGIITTQYEVYKEIYTAGIITLQHEV